MKSYLQFLLLLPVLIISGLSAAAAQDSDEIEFLNGSKITGKITEIRKEQKEFDVEVKVGTRTLTRTYQFAKVHAVVMKGKRHEITPKPVDAAGSITKTQREVEQIIETVGSTPPDWYDSVKLDYPKSLDLSWPLQPADKGWNNQANVGQYIWDIINPNPNRWQSGVRLMHHLLSQHEKQPALLQRDMRTLAGMYFNLFQDYPRAAFWIRKAGVEPGSHQSVMLAECYWRLGNKEMAMDLLKARTQNVNAIKLLGDMQETDKALSLVRAYIKSPNINGQTRGLINLMAGDACRQVARYEEAIEFYEAALNEKSYRNEEYGQRFTARAQDSIDAIRLFDKADITKVANGTYKDQAIGYSGPVVVEVLVADQKIESVKVTQHQEKQFYAAITDTTLQIKNKQGVTNIDGTSGATITSQAIVNATARAIAKGSK
jgi:uncharacterized protein with FMN-binding domain